MKFISTFFIFFCFIIPTLFTQEANNYERSRPSIDPDLDNESIQKDTEKEDWFKYILGANATENFYFLNKNMVVEPPATTRAQNESSIAINPTDPNNIISSAVDYRGCVFYISNDGGKSWRDTVFTDIKYMYVKDTIKNGIQKKDTSFKSWKIGNDPSVGFDDKGNCIVMYGAFPSGVYTGESGVYLSKSSDGGKSWINHIKVIEHKGTMSKDSAFEDKYYIQIDNSKSSNYYGRMYTPWKRVTDRDSATQIVFTYSKDGGMNWSTPVNVSPRKTGISTDTTFGQSFPISSTGPLGEVYVCWNDGPSRSIGFSKSLDGGLTFSTPTYIIKNYSTLGTPRKVKDSSVYHVLKNTFRAETYPTLCVDNSNSNKKGTIYLAYASGTSPKIRFTSSSDGGNTWSIPKLVHSDSTNDKWWPWMNVDVTTGDIAITYSDSRDDPENITVEQYVSYSSDGGDSWIDRKMSDFASDYRKNPFVDNIFAGDYSGNSFYNGKIYPSFLDTRKAKTGSLENDVYTTVVSLYKPQPVSKFKVTGSIINVNQATLIWENPSMETMFKKPVVDYSLLIEKDGKPLITLPAGTIEYIDSVSDVNKEYKYSMKVVTSIDTSQERTAIFNPRNVLIPSPPKFSDVIGYQPEIELPLFIPKYRADSATAFNNPKNYKIFRDGILLLTEPISINDTGKILILKDSPKRGYYKYNAVLTDLSDNESKSSDTILVYVGDGSPYKENFDLITPKFLIPKGWGTTQSISLSAPNSFTDSPTGKYSPNTNNAMQVYPVEITDVGIELQFSHISIVDKGDSAIVEMSLDKGKTFNKIASYNLNSYQEWKDSSANNSDWKREFFTLKIPPTLPPGKSYAIVRFRLKTSALNELDGWYIDDIEFGKTANINSNLTDEKFITTVSPNPFKNTTMITYFLQNESKTSFYLYDNLGREVLSKPLINGIKGYNFITLSSENLSNGIYYYLVKYKKDICRGSILLSK